MIAIRRTAAVWAVTIIASASAPGVETLSEVRIASEAHPLTRLILHAPNDARISLLAELPNAGQTSTIVPGLASEWISLGALELRGLPAFVANGASGNMEMQLDPTRILVSSGYDPPARRGAFVHLPGRSLALGGVYHPADGSALLLMLSPPLGAGRSLELLARASLPEPHDESEDAWLLTQRRSSGLLTHAAADLGLSSPRCKVSLRASLSNGVRTTAGIAGSLALQYEGRTGNLGALAMASTPGYRNPTGTPIRTLQRAVVESEISFLQSGALASAADLTLRLPDSPVTDGSPASLDTEFELETELRFAEFFSAGVVRESENETVQFRQHGSFSARFEALRCVLEVERSEDSIEIDGEVALSIGLLRAALDSTIERTPEATVGTSELALNLLAGPIGLSAVLKLSGYPLGNTGSNCDAWTLRRNLSAVVTVGVETEGPEQEPAPTPATSPPASPLAPVGSR